MGFAQHSLCQEQVLSITEADLICLEWVLFNITNQSLIWDLAVVVFETTCLLGKEKYNVITYIVD